jgi:hypothetical protein
MSKIIVDQLQRKGGKALTLPKGLPSGVTTLTVDALGQMSYTGSSSGSSGSSGSSSSSSSSAPVLVYSLITASTAAVSGTNYIVNTISNAVTLTFPAAPAANDNIRIADGTGTFSTNNLVINGNGKNISGNTTLEVDINNAALSFIYNVSLGWVLI